MRLLHTAIGRYCSATTERAPLQLPYLIDIGHGYRFNVANLGQRYRNSIYILEISRLKIIFVLDLLFFYLTLLLGFFFVSQQLAEANQR